MSERMTIRDIAGFCPEEAVWKMMADISEYLLKDHADCLLSPGSIMIDGDLFLVATGQERVNEFTAPELTDNQKADEKGLVWSLGAIVYYLATGHIIFGGHGSCYQRGHPNVSLPILPKSLQALTPVIQRCLCYSPDERICMKELNDLSVKGLSFCKKQQRQKTVVKERKQETIVNCCGEKWPEEMIEI